MDVRGVREHYENRRQLLEITYGMEEYGVYVRKDRLEDTVHDFKRRIKRSRELCEETYGGVINLNSSAQLSKFLFNTKEKGGLGLLPYTRTQTGWSTAKNDLEKLLDESRRGSPERVFLANLLTVKKYGKALDYLDQYERIADRDGIHPSFNITGTRTTRFSSSNPNAQNIGKRSTNIRGVFGPPPGRIWYAIDYENIELRIFAYSCGDERLIEAFEKGGSVHLVIAEQLWPELFVKLGPTEFKKTKQYGWTKNGNFALIYGAGIGRAETTYHVEGAYDRIREQFPLIDVFMREKAQESRDTGKVITLGGYPLVVARNEPHKAVNFFCQGSAGDAMNAAITRCDNYLLGTDGHMIMTIHDELVFDFPVEDDHEQMAIEVAARMELSGGDIELPTPVSIERITSSWADGVEVNLLAS